VEFSAEEPDEVEVEVEVEELQPEE
jgi:hypothetical protein